MNELTSKEAVSQADELQILNTYRAADFLGCKEITLRKQRSDGKGPAYVKFPNGRIGYTVADLKQYIRENRVLPLGQE